MVRLHDRKLPFDSTPGDLRIVHLVRHPAAVLRSRLPLQAFTRAGGFNPLGTPDGIVHSVCGGMLAKLEPGSADASSSANDVTDGHEVPGALVRLPRCTLPILPWPLPSSSLGLTPPPTIPCR